MEQTINDAIELLANKITSDIKSEDALRFTQAALNLAHVVQVTSQRAIGVSKVAIPSKHYGDSGICREYSLNTTNN